MLLRLQSETKRLNIINPMMETYAEATDTAAEVEAVRKMFVGDFFEWLDRKREQRKGLNEFQAALHGRKTR